MFKNAYAKYTIGIYFQQLKMKILHLGKYYPPYFGGIEKVNFDLVEELNKNNVSTDVLCFNDEFVDVVEEKNYIIYRAINLVTAFSTPFSLSYYRILKRIHHVYDIIHIHLPNPGGAIALQSVNFKGKIVVHWHSDIIKQKILKHFYAPFQKALLKRAACIVVTSPPYLEGSDDLKPFKNKCKVIPIGINKNDFILNDDFLEILKSRYLHKKVIFSVGRLIYYKGFNYLIEAAKYLPDDYIILIGGTGELENELAILIKEFRVESKVELLGKISFNDISSYFELCEVYCLPSCEKSEAFGVVQIEAMSFGKPLVSTNILNSGVPWINKNENTGLIVAPKNSKELALAIKRIISDPILAKEYGNNGKLKYLQEFTIEKMVASTIELYQNLLQN